MSANALLKQDAHLAAFAAAFVVCFVYDIRRGERLESEQKGNADGGKETPCLLAHAPESTEPEHDWRDL